MKRIMNSLSATLSLLPMVVLLASPVFASQTQWIVNESHGDFFGGDYFGVQLNDGAVTLGPSAKALVDDAPGPVLALCRKRNTTYYVTSGESRLYKHTDGAASAQMITKLKAPLVTSLHCVGESLFAVVSGKKAGVLELSHSGEKKKFVEVQNAKLLLGASLLNNTLFMAGSDDEGGILVKWDGKNAPKVLARLEGQPLRSVHAFALAGRQRVVVGTQKKGRVYAYEKERFRALADAGAAEVTALVSDGSGAVFASIVDADGKLTKVAAKKDDDDKKKSKPKRKPRKIKSSEVIRIDTNGAITVLWQSKHYGAYDMLMRDKKLLVATGAQGRLLSLNPNRRADPGVLTHVENTDEIIALLDTGKTVLMGTAHPGGIAQLEQPKKGRFESAVFKIGGLASFGTIAVTGSQLKSLALRTGHTEKPDASWSDFVVQKRGALDVPRGTYAQVRVELGPKSRLERFRLSYLKDNRAPQIERIDVLASGWKVTVTPREASTNRSVSFGDAPFKNFLDHREAKKKKLKLGGKQTQSPGYRTVYVQAADDKDTLRYRFFLAKLDKKGVPLSWSYVKEWSKEPFYSFQASRLADGAYQVRVEVDDKLSNGARAFSDRGSSPAFQVSHRVPTFAKSLAQKRGEGVRVRLVVDADAALMSVRCSVGGGDWMVLDPIDGITDEKNETYDVTLEGRAAFGSVSCEASDANDNTQRVDLTTR